MLPTLEPENEESSRRRRQATSLSGKTSREVDVRQEQKQKHQLQDSQDHMTTVLRNKATTTATPSTRCNHYCRQDQPQSRLPSATLLSQQQQRPRPGPWWKSSRVSSLLCAYYLGVISFTMLLNEPSPMEHLQQRRQMSSQDNHGAGGSLRAMTDKYLHCPTIMVDNHSSATAADDPANPDITRHQLSTPTNSTTTTMTSSSTSSDNNNNQNNPNFTIYGLVHYMKTASTTINGELAARYERVCGNKGYSYDSYQFNRRVEQQQNRGKRKRALTAYEAGGPDSIRRLYTFFNRGVVPQSVMDEIGYENCDYIALEIPWTGWKERIGNLSSSLSSFHLELHVPCREPIPHLLSQCAFQNHNFDCQATNLTHEIGQCLVEPDRFDVRLEESPFVVSSSAHNTNAPERADLPQQPSPPNNRAYSLKCFNPIPVKSYVQYMGQQQRLQPKRIPAKYMFRSTNEPHDPKHECLRQPEYRVLAHQVKQRLMQMVPYYQWCQQCLLDPQRNLLYLSDNR
ncbi:hypothetical protein ACA910_007624 [Epithemia clementina (nom. ined.)]